MRFQGVFSLRGRFLTIFPIYGATADVRPSPRSERRRRPPFWQGGIQYDPHVQYLQERLAVPEGTPAVPAAGMEMFEPGSVNDCDLSVCNSAHLLNYKSNYIDLSADSLGQLLRQWARFPVQ